MVTPTEIKQQIAQREQQFQQARQQLAQVPTKITTSQRQLLQQRGIASREQIRSAQQKRKQQISQAKQQLTKQEQTFKKQIAPVQKQIATFEAARAAAQSEAAEWNKAVQIIRSARKKDRPIGRVSGSLQRKIDDILGGATPPGVQTVPFDQEILQKAQIDIAAIKLDLGPLEVQAPIPSPELVFTGEQVFRTARGGIVGKGFLRPTAENIAKGGGIVGGPLVSIDGKLIPLLVSPSFEIPGQPKFGVPDTPKFQAPEIPTIEFETQRFRDAGFNPTQARRLARESVKLGGVSFTEEATREIIRAPIPIKEIKEKTRALIQRAKEKRIPVVGKSILELTGKGVRTKTVTLRSGERVIVPEDFVEPPIELPDVSQFPEEIKTTLEELPTSLFFEDQTTNYRSPSST